jgi:hypothetical protein
VIGHPKALTPYSLDTLDQYLAAGAAREVVTFSSYLEQGEGVRAAA